MGESTHGRPSWKSRRGNRTEKSEQRLMRIVINNLNDSALFKPSHETLIAAILLFHLTLVEHLLKKITADVCVIRGSTKLTARLNELFSSNLHQSLEYLMFRTKGKERVDRYK